MLRLPVSAASLDAAQANWHWLYEGLFSSHSLNCKEKPGNPDLMTEINTSVRLLWCLLRLTNKNIADLRTGWDIETSLHITNSGFILPLFLKLNFRGQTTKSDEKMYYGWAHDNVHPVLNQSTMARTSVTSTSRRYSFKSWEMPYERQQTTNFNVSIQAKAGS